MKNLLDFKALKASRFLALILRTYTGQTLMHAFTPVTPYKASVMHVPFGLVVLNRRYSYGLISQDRHRDLAMEFGRLSLEEIKSLFDDLMIKQDWQGIKNKFEKWVSPRTRNFPDLLLVNCYMRSCSMLGNSLKDMFVLLEQVKRDYHITPDTLSYNIILASAHRSHGVNAAVKILNWMIGEQLSKEDSYTLVVKMLVQYNEFQSAMTYVKLASQQAYINPMEILVNAVVKYGNNEKASKSTRIKARISKSVVSIFSSYKLESMRKDNPHHKFVAGLNCLILVYANMKDVVRAMRTFKAISNSFGLTHDINSYNAIIYAYIQRKQRNEAIALFNDLVHVGIEPNVITETLMFKAIVIEGLRYAIELMKKVSSVSTSPSPIIGVARKKKSYYVDKGCVWTRK